MGVAVSKANIADAACFGRANRVESYIVTGWFVSPGGTAAEGQVAESMTERTRRNHAAACKAKAALAAIKGEKTLAELAQQFDVHLNRVGFAGGCLV